MELHGAANGGHVKGSAPLLIQQAETLVGVGVGSRLEGGEVEREFGADHRTDGPFSDCEGTDGPFAIGEGTKESFASAIKMRGRLAVKGGFSVARQRG